MGTTNEQIVVHDDRECQIALSYLFRRLVHRITDGRQSVSLSYGRLVVVGAELQAAAQHLLLRAPSQVGVAVVVAVAAHLCTKWSPAPVYGIGRHTAATDTWVAAAAAEHWWVKVT